MMLVENVLRAPEIAMGAPPPITRNGWMRLPGISSMRKCSRGSSQKTEASLAPPTELVEGGGMEVSSAGTGHGKNGRATRRPNAIELWSSGWNGASSINPSFESDE